MLLIIQINIAFDLKAALCECVFILYTRVLFIYIKTVLIQIRQDLLKAADQDPHFFASTRYKLRIKRNGTTRLMVKPEVHIILSMW